MGEKKNFTEEELKFIDVSVHNEARKILREHFFSGKFAKGGYDVNCFHEQYIFWLESIVIVQDREKTATEKEKNNV